MEATVKHKTTPKPDSHSARVRASWRQHLEAQRASGLKQSEYCRAHGLQPKYFSLWKRRLADEGVATAPTPGAKPVAVSVPAGSTASPPPLIPVTIKAESSPALPPKPRRGRRAVTQSERDQPSSEALAIKARLPNGILLDVFLPSRSLLPGFLSDLAGLAC